MFNELQDPNQPEEEPVPNSGGAESLPESSPAGEDYVSELRETLGSEDVGEKKTARKSGFFGLFSRRQKQAEESGKTMDGLSSSESIDTPEESQEDGPTFEVEDLSSRLSLIETNSLQDTSTANVEFVESAFPLLDMSELEHSDEDLYEAPPAATPLDEESPQWKSFLSTLWKPGQDKDEPEIMDDETVADRIERSLLVENQDGGEWGDREETPFLLDGDQVPTVEPPEGRRVTGPLYLNEDDISYIQEEGAVWDGLRDEIQTTPEEIVPEEPVESGPFEETLPFSNVAFAGWDGVESDVPAEEAFVDEEAGVEESEVIPRRAFSEEYAELFDETAPAQPETEQEPEQSVQEIRTIVLEDYEEPVQPARSVEGKGEPVENMSLKNWIATRPWPIQMALVALVLLTVILIVSVPLLALQRQPEPAPISSALPTTIPMGGMPYPTGLKMTGGWFFYLQRSTMRDGQWAPETSEWLEGSELRRVVALPWTKQSEAVVQSLAAGDSIELHMSNNDIVTYQVATIDRVDRSDVSALAGNDPALVIILYQTDSDERWLVVSNPKE